MWVLGNVLNVVVFIVKCWILVFVMIWIRWTLPRLRIDQVMMTCLKYLLPLSCVLFLGVCVWNLALPQVVLNNLKFVLAAVTVLLSVGGLVMAYRFSMQAMPVPPGIWASKPG